MTPVDLGGIAHEIEQASAVHLRDALARQDPVCAHGAVSSASGQRLVQGRGCAWAFRTSASCHYSDRIVDRAMLGPNTMKVEQEFSLHEGFEPPHAHPFANRDGMPKR